MDSIFAEANLRVVFICVVRDTVDRLLRLDEDHEQVRKNYSQLREYKNCAEEGD